MKKRYTLLAIAGVFLVVGTYLVWTGRFGVDIGKFFASEGVAIDLSDAYGISKDGLVLRYDHYEASGVRQLKNLFSTNTIKYFDDTHFSIIRTFGNDDIPNPDPSCPRIEDTYVWRGDDLFYTNTYEYYPEKNIRSERNPGQLWLTSGMMSGISLRAETISILSDIEHENCSITEETVQHTQPFVTWLAAYKGQTAWSPFTGGESQPQDVVRLDEVTFFEGNPEDVFKEEWFFFDHSTYGLIAIYSRGTRRFPDGRLEELWNIRLTDISDGDAVIATEVPLTATPEPESTSETPVSVDLPVVDGDIDGDGDVDIFDYNVVVSNFGRTEQGINGDIDGDGDVDIFDYNVIISNFGN